MLSLSSPISRSESSESESGVRRAFEVELECGDSWSGGISFDDLVGPARCDGDAMVRHEAIPGYEGYLIKSFGSFMKGKHLDEMDIAMSSCRIVLAFQLAETPVDA